MFESEASSRFNRSLRSSYAYSNQLIDRDWVWEWVRRHPEFQMAWWHSHDAFEITFTSSTLTVINARANAIPFDRWGCIYSDPPDIDARFASVF